MGLLDQLDRAVGLNEHGEAAFGITARVRSLVVRCDKCPVDDGTGPDGGYWTVGDCDGGCVNGWQPSDKLIEAVMEPCPDGPMADIARTVLRLLDGDD